MSWPYYNGDGSLADFTEDQTRALELSTADIRNGDHPTFNLDALGCSIRRQWFSKWTQRDNSIAYTLGAAAIYGTFPNYKLSRVMPQVFPDAGYEQYAALALEDGRGARSAGINDANVVPAYKSSKLVFRYEQVFFGLATDAQVAAGFPEYNRYVQRLPSTVETSYLSLPGSMMKLRTFGGSLPPNGTIVPYNVGKPEVVSRVAFKWWRLPYEAWVPGSPLYTRVYGNPSNTTLVPVSGAPSGYGKVVGTPYIGCVSSAAMLGYPVGQALFEGVEEEIVPDPVRGFPAWNLTFKFLVKANRGGTAISPEPYGGHNFIYYGGVTGTNVAGYYQATKANSFVIPGTIWDGACLFNERNLLNLWNVGAVADADI